jgi:hypothetical protein
MSEDRIASRAEHLLPEEERVHVDNPRELSRAVLQESDERQEDPAGTAKEHRSSRDASR